MNKVTPEAVKSLLEVDGDAVTSLYLPTHRSPTSVHIQEDKIRFKNLIRAGKEALEARGAEEDSIRKVGNLLEEDLYSYDNFWQHTTEGLAVFCSLSGVHYFHLPMECEEYADGGDTYDITPLLAMLSYEQAYYVLALAVHGPTLYRGDMYGIEQVAIELPESPEVALNIDELFSNSRTVRAGGGYGPGSPSSGAHGQGDSRQAGQEEKAEFYRIIVDIIMSSNQVEQDIPLLVAGPDSEIAGFRAISRNKQLTRSNLAGNYTVSSGVKPHEVHARSWLLIEEEFGKSKQARERDRFSELHGTGRSSADPDDISAAAKEGRVDTLLLGMFTVTRDTISDGSEAKKKLLFPDSYNENALGAIGRNVYSQGGRIIALPRDDMPDNAAQAAIYRY
jgi:hypothetical protein